jgi:hypothetical protein
MFRKYNSRYAFVRPLEIALDFLSGSDAISKVGLRSGETALCERLQFHQLAGFGIELPGAAILVSSVLKTVN